MRFFPSSTVQLLYTATLLTALIVQSAPIPSSSTSSNAIVSRMLGDDAHSSVVAVASTQEQQQQQYYDEQDDDDNNNDDDNDDNEDDGDEEQDDSHWSKRASKLCGADLRGGNFADHCKNAAHHYSWDSSTGDIDKASHSGGRPAGGQCDHILEIQTVQGFIKDNPAAQAHCDKMKADPKTHAKDIEKFHGIVAGKGNLVYVTDKVNGAKGQSFNTRVGQAAMEKKNPALLKGVHGYLQDTRPNAVQTGQHLDHFFGTNNKHFETYANHVWSTKDKEIKSAYTASCGGSLRKRSGPACAWKPPTNKNKPAVAHTPPASTHAHPNAHSTTNAHSTAKAHPNTKSSTSNRRPSTTSSTSRSKLGRIASSASRAVRKAPTAARKASKPSIARKAFSAARKAPSAARKAPSTARKAPSTTRKAPSTARKAPSTARKAPSTARKAPSAARKATSSIKKAVSSVRNAHAPAKKNAGSPAHNAPASAHKPAPKKATPPPPPAKAAPHASAPKKKH